MFTALEVYYLSCSKRGDIPYTWKFVSKAALIAALVIISVWDIGKAISARSYETVYDVDYYTPVIKIATFVSTFVQIVLFLFSVWSLSRSLCWFQTLAGVLLHYNRKCGMRTSGLLFLFWFFLALCGAVQYRSLLRDSVDHVRNSIFFIIDKV